MSRLDTVPLNVAVSVVTFLDPLEMRALFSASRRWQGVGLSEGVCQHLISSVYKIAVAQQNQEHQEQQQQPQQQTSGTTTKKPSEILLQDPDFGPHPALAASFARKIALLRTFCEENGVGRVTGGRQAQQQQQRDQHGEEEEEEAGRFSSSPPAVSPPISLAEIEALFRRPSTRTENNNHHNNGNENGDDSSTTATTAETQNATRDKSQLYKMFWEETATPQVRLLFRCMNGTSPNRFASPFGVVKSYDMVDALVLHPLEKNLRIMEMMPEFLQKNVFVIGSYGQAVVCVATRDFGGQDAPKQGRVSQEEEEAENGDHDDGEEHQTSPSANSENENAPPPPPPPPPPFNVYRVPKDRVILLRGRTVIALASSLHNLLRFWVKHLGKRFGLSRWKLESDDGEENESSDDDDDDDDQENADDFDTDGQPPPLQILRFHREMRAAQRRRQRQQRPVVEPRRVTVISCFPRYLEQNSPSTSSLQRRCSRCETQTKAGTIVVEMSSALLPSRSGVARYPDHVVYFFAYRCRMWREVNDEDDVNNSVGGGDDEAQSGDGEPSSPQSCYSVRLTRRRWRIFATHESRVANEPTDVVEGDGVIGMFPRLLPLRPELAANPALRDADAVPTDKYEIDGVFEYESATNVHQAFGGSVEGAFEFEFELPTSMIREDVVERVWVKVGNFGTELNESPYAEEGMNSPFLYA